MGFGSRYLSLVAQADLVAEVERRGYRMLPAGTADAQAARLSEFAAAPDARPVIQELAHLASEVLPAAVRELKQANRECAELRTKLVTSELSRGALLWAAVRTDEDGAWTSA